MHKVLNLAPSFYIYNFPCHYSIFHNRTKISFSVKKQNKKFPNFFSSKKKNIYIYIYYRISFSFKKIHNKKIYIYKKKGELPRHLRGSKSLPFCSSHPCLRTTRWPPLVWKDKRNPAFLREKRNGTHKN